MIHPHTELRYVSKSIGYGVFATQFIPKGTIIWVLDELDQKLDESYIYSLDPIRKSQLIKYCYRDEQGKYILCWDIARYMNHKFQANCICTAYQFELAAKDILPGEELTEDYGYFNLDEPFYCFPEKESSRTKVMPDDILHFYPEWDHKASEAMKHFNQVDQPLKGLVNPKYMDKVSLVADGEEPIDSIISCYYDRFRNFKVVN